MNEVLIVGSNGFIGSYLYKKLNSFCSCKGLDHNKKSIFSNYYSVDLTKNSEVKNFVDNIPKCDVLIFLVGLAHKKGKGKELDEFRRINKQTLVNLISAIDKANKLPGKIIFASTISVYGEKLNEYIYNEDSLKKPLSPYAITKLEAEEYLLNNYNNQSWILRFAPVYSHSFQLNINRRTKAGRLFYKVGNGKKKLSLCNLENIGLVVKGIIANEIPAGVYNISDAEDYTYNDLLLYKNTKWILNIPNFLVKSAYYVGKTLNNVFLKENTIKLISDNIFPSIKIRQFIELSYTVYDTLNEKNLK